MNRWGPRVGAAVLVLLAALWVLSGITSYDVVADVAPADGGLGASAAHWLGTDHLGRDVAWRLVVGSQAFFGPGLLACAVALAVGLPGAAVGGYLGGGWAWAFRYGVAVLASVPRFVLVLLACAIYGSEPTVLAVAAGIAFAPALGEAVFARLDALRQAEFVLAAEAHGHSRTSVLFRQLLWANCRSLLARQLLLLFGFVLVLETTLSYIGDFGIEEPQPSWGNMLAFEFGIVGGNPLAWLVPAAAIWITVLSITWLSRGLAEPEHG